MVLESTMICFDNSEYMRNEDYIPTRLHAQKDAVIDICYSRHRRNPQNDVGLLTLADVRVLASLTNDVGTIVCRLHEIHPDGKINIHKGIRVAHMALRHRPEKHFKMRIVLLIGSPANVTVGEMISIGKTLRKENVNIDIVSFGEVSQNEEILKALFNTVNGKDGRNCNYIAIQGPDFTEGLRGSPLMDGFESVAHHNITSSNIDEINDPDLIIALQLSLEEEQRRQQEIDERARNPNAGNNSTQSSSKKRKHYNSDTSLNIDFSQMTEEEQMAFALRMSVEQGEPKNKKTKREGDKDSEIEQESKKASSTTINKKEDQNHDDSTS